MSPSPSAMDLVVLLLLLFNVLSDGTRSQENGKAPLAPPPVEVRFESLDFRNVLRWTPLSSSSANYTYQVQWKIYGEAVWNEAEGCLDIQKSQCDLSNVTSELREWYYARVRSSFLLLNSQSAWVLSTRFNPRWDTNISMPIVRLSALKQSIVVRVRRRTNGVWADIQRTYGRPSYNIYLKHNSGEEKVYRVHGPREKVLEGLSPRTRYCLQAQTLITFLGKSSERSPLRCITTL